MGKKEKKLLVELMDDFIQETMKYKMIELSQYFNKKINIFVNSSPGTFWEEKFFYFWIVGWDWKIYMDTDLKIDTPIEKILSEIFFNVRKKSLLFMRDFFEDILSIAGQIMFERWENHKLIPDAK